MLNFAKNKLNNTELIATRDGLGKGVIEAWKENKNVVFLSADLAESTRGDWFEKVAPENFIEVGVAEQNMAALASGFAAVGKIPFIASFAMFSPGRNWEQIRTTIALNNQPVIISSTHAGLTVGEDGATHQALEDIAIMRAIPNMAVIAPCDFEEAKKATIVAAKYGKPVYIRYSREKTPLITTEKTKFEIGKAYEIWREKKPKCVIISTGIMAHNSILAAEELSKKGIGVVVLNSHTIKPLDEKKIVALARECKAVVTVEEHQIIGGLGSAVAELLSKKMPTKIEMVGVKDKFGQSGKAGELLKYYGLDASAIVRAVKSVLKK